MNLDTSTTTWLSLTADKGYLEELNVYDENNGVKFILEKYIIDKTGLVFFYSFEKDGEKIENPSELHFMLNDDKGNWLMGPHGIGDFFVGYGAEKFDFTEIIHRKRMNNDNSDFVLPDKFILTAIEGKSTNVSDPIAGAENVWEVEIPVDREKVNKSERRIIMNKTVEIGGQKILFKEATLYPTIAVVDVFYDDANTMNIFEIEDVVLADETGTIWRQIYDRNYDDLWFGYDGKYLDLQPNQRRLFFETPLFNEPKELTIKATGIRAIDKEKKIVIDPVNQILLEAPDDNLELKGVSIDDNLVLDFKLSLRRKYDDPNYEEAESQYYVSFDPSSSFTSDHERSKDFILDKGTDAEGVPLKFYRCERRRNKPDGYMNMKYEFKFDKPLTGPLTFDIRDYRNWIKEDIEVPIIP